MLFVHIQEKHWNAYLNNNLPLRFSGQKEREDSRPVPVDAHLIGLLQISGKVDFRY
jgi:hypothetical protein